MRTNSSEHLIIEFINGNKNSFIELIKKEETFIKKILYMLLNGNLEDIKDVQQEVLMALYNNLKNFKFNSAFKTYLYRFVKNKAIDHIRKQKRFKQLKEKIQKFNINRYNENNQLENQFIMNENKAKLFKMISSLNKEEKTLILLKDIEEMSLKDISEIINMNINTIKTKLHRARSKLCSLLKDDYYERV
ncbi:MAG: RNA polymerase sigma factor [Spirochaetes bacterium]|nr:RNA polymerase sigma factor [Spirochaetota bacterium]